MISKSGFGFIQPDNSEEDAFFHVSGVKDTPFDSLKINDTVDFDLLEGPKGLKAKKVTIVTLDSKNEE